MAESGYEDGGTRQARIISSIDFTFKAREILALSMPSSLAKHTCIDLHPLLRRHEWSAKERLCISHTGAKLESTIQLGIVGTII